jgi:hypothetical protein
MLTRLWFSLPALALGTLIGWSGGILRAIAAPPETAPAELVSALDQMETAANAQDLEAVMALYASGFTHNDGFDHSQLEAGLAQLWQQYPDLTYEVELVSWEDEGNTTIAETVTTIRGQGEQAGRMMTLEAEMRSRQSFENGQIVAQEVLSESTQVSSGDNPPDLLVLLPETVTPGASFGFDAIVQEPLGDRLLLGTAVDEGTTATDFFTPRPSNFQLLSAGGLFKVGDAPDQADDRWISGVVVREDGLVVVTRRLSVQD